MKKYILQKEVDKSSSPTITNRYIRHCWRADSCHSYRKRWRWRRISLSFRRFKNSYWKYKNIKKNRRVKDEGEKESSGYPDPFVNGFFPFVRRSRMRACSFFPKRNIYIYNALLAPRCVRVACVNASCESAANCTPHDPGALPWLFRFAFNSATFLLFEIKVFEWSYSRKGKKYIRANF